ncbi:MAG: phosphoribosyl-ATP diphosphatase [Pseudomonadota bacterium]
MSSRQEIGSILTELFSVIEKRRGASPDSSYTAHLLSGGETKCAQKFGEEAVEAVIAGAAGDAKALTAEAADALYHLLVLLAANNVALEDVAAELKRRQGVSGHTEKAARDS